MWRPHPILTACLVVVSFATAGQAQFPFEGTVQVQRSLSVRSGPSENYYRTSLLRPGDRVTVMGEAPDGWVAIQPPADSFSWISGQHVREITPTEAEVVGDRVNVRVGTLINE